MGGKQVSCNCARTACNTSIDYTLVPGDRILPFEFTLDLENSNLYPEAGENQRFCYTVRGMGEDNSDFADLSHFVLGVCPEITEDMLENVRVVIDGVPQEVEIGENVEIQTEAQPDPTTGCAGLKVDFGLDKVDGLMQFCFELTRPFAIGAMPVCVKGGQQTAGGLAICGPVCGGETSCTVYGSPRATVCVPVTVTPFASVGDTVTRCCGNPRVTPGTAACGGTPMGSCVFTISQDVCITVPVAFGATSVVGRYSVLCGDANTGDNCPDCGDTV